MKRLILVLALFAVLVPFAAATAQATPLMLRVEWTTNGISDYLDVVDGGAGDDSSLDDVIDFSGIVGSMSLDMHTATAESEQSLPGLLGRLILSSMYVHNEDGPASLRLTVVDSYYGVSNPSGFALADAKAIGNLDAPFGGTIQVQSWVAPVVGGTFPSPLPPAGSTALYVENDPGNPGVASSGDGPFLFSTDDYLIALGGDFSLITVVEVSFDGTGSTSLTDASAAVSPVPEPASMFLVGSGLLGLAASVRRRNRSRKLDGSV